MLSICQRLLGRVAGLLQLYEVSNNPGRLLPMEGVRGLAVLLVFFVHFHVLFCDYVERGGILFSISRFAGTVGHAGVDLFFVLSGCLIYGALIRNPVRYVPFMQRRIQRIYPAFLCVFGTYLFLSFLFPGLSRIPRSAGQAVLYILQNVLLLPGVMRIEPVITVAWSLSYEIFFYLSVPLLIWVTAMRRWNPAMRVLFFLALWLCYIAYSFSVPASRVRGLMFVVGIVLYESLEWRPIRRLLTPSGEVIAIALFLASMVFAYVLDTRPDMLALLPHGNAGRTLLPGVPVYQGPYKVIGYSLSFYLFSLYCFGRPGRLHGWFSWGPLRYLGNMSYSYYLVHGLTLRILVEVARHLVPPTGHQDVVFILSLLGTFGATLATSSLLFLVIEKPVSIQRRPVVDLLRQAGCGIRRVWRESAGSPASPMALAAQACSGEAQGGCAEPDSKIIPR